MTKLHIDFETRSTVDLKKAGLDNYARHPSTEPWCIAYAFDDEPVCLTSTIDPNKRGMHSKVLSHIRASSPVYAHNAAFELAIWNNICVPRYGWPVLKTEQCRCTMAMAYAMALPGSLEKAAAAVGIKEQKDMSGSRLMMQMAQPRGFDAFDEPIWWDEPDKLEKLYEYCRQDVRVERELEKRLMPLSDDEQALWVLDQKINSRGVQIDTASVTKAVAIVQAEKKRLDEEMSSVTGGILPTEVKRLTDWVRSRGVPVEGLAKADVLDHLSGSGLPDDVRRALTLRQEAGKSSTAKLKAMIESASADGRVRGTLQYHGAGTGRWAGRRVQMHNMVRPKMKFKEIEDVIAHL
jgi:DNA polymerase bacteriophage-type